jgi:signal transduction histidine kinase
VLTNLIDNAVKYGRAGGTVRLSAAAATGGRRRAPAWCWRWLMTGRDPASTGAAPD